MASVLGRSDDAKKYATLAQNIKDAFNKRYFDPRTNQYATGSQTSNSLPVYLDMAPPEKVPAIVKNLVDDIVTKHDTHVSTGIIGSNAVIQVLPSHGATRLMYALANQTTYPSLGEQVMKGATTVCETYECGPWLSQNMKMFGSIDKFFYRDLAGISSQSPGYRRVLIKPQPVGDLRTVSASEQTVRGPVSVEWVKGDGALDLKVSVPAGVEADVNIPQLGLTGIQIMEGDHTVWHANAYVAGDAGITGAEADADSIVFHVGSGAYSFAMTGSTF
jgi:alpha-L-rhamnosidase